MSDEGGTVVLDGTCEATRLLGGGMQVHDFRDLDGETMDLPPGCTFQVILSDLRP